MLYAAMGPLLKPEEQKAAMAAIAQALAGRQAAGDRKVAMIASAMADLVSRERGEIDQSTLDDYFTAAANILQPLPTAGLGQVVTFIAIDDEGEATVKWSQASGTGAAREVDSPFPLAATTEVNQLARNAGGW